MLLNAHCANMSDEFNSHLSWEIEHEVSVKHMDSVNTSALLGEAAQAAYHEALLPGLAKSQNMSLRTITGDQKNQKTVALRMIFFSPSQEGAPLLMTGSNQGMRRGTL